MSAELESNILCRGCGIPLSDRQVQHQLGNSNYNEWCRKGYCSLQCYEKQRGLPLEIKTVPVRETTIAATQGVTLARSSSEAKTRVKFYPTEQLQKKVAHKKAGEEMIQNIKNTLPLVSSAYQPSGKLPPLAFLCLLAGAILGIPLAALAGVISGAIGAVILFVLFMLWSVARHELPTIIQWFLVAAIGMGILITILCCIFVPWALVGMTAAWCTTSLGRLGKNRNIEVSSVFSLLSGLSAIFLVQVIPNQLSAEHSVITWIGIAIGSVVVIVAAIYGAGEAVRGAKFCEACQRYMERSPSRLLSFGCLKAMAKTFADRELGRTADLLQAPLGEGGGKLNLFTCTSCGRAYLELLAAIEVQWEGGKKQEEWLVGSLALASDETVPFNSCSK